MEMLEQGSNGNGSVEVEDRLAGIVVTFRSTADGPVTEDELLEDALERTERTEDQAEQLAGKVEKALSKISALGERFDELAERVEALEEGEQDDAPAVPTRELEEMRAAVAEAQRQAADAQREAQATRRILAALRPMPGGAGDEAEAMRPPRDGFDDTDVPMATLTLGGHFMELNPGFRRLVGYSEEEFSSARWPSNVDRARFARARGPAQGARGRGNRGGARGTGVHAPRGPFGGAERANRPRAYPGWGHPITFC